MSRGATWGLLVVAAAACRDTSVTSKGCHADGECGKPAGAWRCEVSTGACFCRQDAACAGSQFCNRLGFCQDRAGCEKNADCLDASKVCDTASGQCLPVGRCTSDLECPLGQICDRTSRCVEGCRRQGDCPGTSCRCGEGPCSCNAGSESCDVGVCDATFCTDSSFCRFGETCGVPDGGTGRAHCFEDYDPESRPYCDRCTFGGGLEVCGRGPNYCLIDTRHPGGSFCGADCAEGQSCPRGYSCQDVIVVFSQWVCSRTNPACPTNPALPCRTDDDCKRGGNCVKSPGLDSGFCAGKCAIDEGDQNGFCSCQLDADCPQETCSGGECSISRRKCVTDPDCRSIRCVDYAGSGGCLIGRNCGPTDGLSCNEVR